MSYFFNKYAPNDECPWFSHLCCSNFRTFFANISMGEKCLGGCLEKIFQFQRQFCEKRLTLEVWSCKVYNISNSSTSLHLCPLTWSVLSWSLLSLSANLRNSICLNCKINLSDVQNAFVPNCKLYLSKLRNITFPTPPPAFTYVPWPGQRCPGHFYLFLPIY